MPLSIRGFVVGSNWSLSADDRAGSSVKARLERMVPRFLERFGERVRDLDLAFLDGMASEEHVSRSRVWFVLARSPVVGDNQRQHLVER